ncbi:MAG: cytochrome c [Acidobacteria bacterium]|nr:MAG: cytochrome c [Acidobacteriota bacterium]REK10177.1 MAG: cytochrome c [Acidobacteriota bacterium]
MPVPKRRLVGLGLQPPTLTPGRGRAMPAPGLVGSGTAPSLAIVLGALLLGGCVREPDPAAIWARECASCHAEDGRGEARKLPLSPGLDLHESPMVIERARGPIYRVIRQGYSGMPGFDHRLEHREIEALVTYVIDLVHDGSEEPP